MLNKNARKWVKALLSGKYKKGKNYLRPSDNKFCCLGVACDLYAKENSKVKWVKKQYGSSGDYYYFSENTQVLPKKVINWLGLASDDGMFYIEDIEDSDFCSLTKMNDGGKSFSQIAKFIESNPRGLFK